MYEYVAHRKSLANIAETLKDCFGLPISTSQVSNFKQLLAHYYAVTYKRLLERILSGSLIHGDETEVTVKKVGKGYVWVLTNMEEVVYMYRKSREGDFLHDLLKGFRGVFVSDFYAAYDSLPCEQQKCLIHLIRDINTDVKANPWDEELKALASGFGTLLRTIVSTIDQYGLKARHLGKHRRDVDKFFQGCKGHDLRSEVAEALRKRLLKCQDKLFTFLGHDGVPWNNNNAEHALKRFAQYPGDHRWPGHGGRPERLPRVAQRLPDMQIQGRRLLEVPPLAGDGHRQLLSEGQRNTRAKGRDLSGRCRVAASKSEADLGATVAAEIRPIPHRRYPPRKSELARANCLVCLQWGRTRSLNRACCDLNAHCL